MLKLHQFPRALGIANPSPTCMKVETWLRMTGIPYEVAPADLAAEAPKGKAPYITTEENQRIGDSSFILDYLRNRYGTDPDSQLSRAERAVSTAFRRMLKEHLYWVIVQTRYFSPANWELFRPGLMSLLPLELPPEVREDIVEGIKKSMAQQIIGHGMGRHTEEEIFRLGIQDLAALSNFLDKRPFLMGEVPTTLDATAYGFLANLLLVPFASPVRDFGLAQQNLTAYCQRMGSRFFPELAAG